jgi:hypothetical protein
MDRQRVLTAGGGGGMGVLVMVRGEEVMVTGVHRAEREVVIGMAEGVLVPGMTTGEVEGPGGGDMMVVGVLGVGMVLAVLRPGMGLAVLRPGMGLAVLRPREGMMIEDIMVQVVRMDLRGPGMDLQGPGGQMGPGVRQATTATSGIAGIDEICTALGIATWC